MPGIQVFVLIWDSIPDRNCSTTLRITNSSSVLWFFCDFGSDLKFNFLNLKTIVLEIRGQPKQMGKAISFWIETEDQVLWNDTRNRGTKIAKPLESSD